MSQDRLLRQFLSKLVLILDLLNRVMPKSQIEAKLDQIIEKLDGLTARVDRIEKSVTGVQRQVIEADAKLSKRCEALELSLQKKAETTEFLDLKIQVEDLAKQRVEEREVMIKQQQMITQLTNQLQGYKQTTERENLSREAYSKRFNLLVHGLEEDQTNPWENRTVTENLLKKFFIQGLKMENPEQINIVDLHRLPQYPLFKNNKRINRPIIFKVANNSDKQMILNSLKNLRGYNEDKKSENSKATKIYVTEHLPKTLYEEKKRLLPQYHKARSEKKRVNWCIQNGEYSLYVEGKKVEA